MEEVNDLASLVKNYIFIGISKAVQVVAAFFILIAVTRYLSVEEFGEYSFIMAFVSSVMALTYFGIQQIVIREISRDRKGAAYHLGDAILLRSFLAVIAVLISLVAIRFMKSSNLMIIVILIAMSSEIFLTFGMLSRAVFQAFEKMAYEPILVLVYYLILSVGVGMVIYLDLGFLWLFAIIAFSNTINFIIAYYFLSTRFVRPIFRLDMSRFWVFLKDSSIIGIGIFFYQNLFRVNLLMLKWLSESKTVALFQVPHNLIMQMELLPQALVTALFPTISRLLHYEYSRMANIYEKVFRYMFILSFISAIYLAIFSQEIIRILFGGRYDESVPVMKIVSWSIIPLTMDMFLNSVLIAMNKQRYNVIYCGFALLINFLAAMILIPLYGYMAAAYTAIFSYTFVFLFSLYFISKNGLPLVVDKVLPKMAIAGLLSGITIISLKSNSLYLAIPMGVVVYSTALLIMHAFPENEITWFKGMIRTFKSI